MKRKNFAWLLVGITFLYLLLLNIFWGQNWIDSDMAAEMIFSKLLADEGKYISTSNWFYSTEFRVIYTQLIMVPLFKIFHNWHVIRIITNCVTYLLLIASYMYFMKMFAINKYLVILSSIILLRS